MKRGYLRISRNAQKKTKGLCVGKTQQERAEEFRIEQMQKGGSLPTGAFSVESLKIKRKLRPK